MCLARASAQVDDAASKYGKAQSRHRLATLDPPPLRSTSAPICSAQSHRKWLLKPRLIGHNMHKFRQHLRRDRQPVPSREQLPEQAQSLCMLRVLHDLHGQEEACIQAMRHTRPSSISLYHSSRAPIGLRIVPTLTGSVSRRLGFCACSFARRALRMICSNSANSSAENCATDFSISASVHSREMA